MNIKVFAKQQWRAFLDKGINIFLLSVFTGFFAGVIVTVYNMLISIGEETSLEMYALVRENPIFIPILFLALAVGAILIGTIVRFVPMIRGSGIPQIEGAARGIVKFKWYVTICSMFAASLACIFLGLSAGGEGPSLEIGGASGAGTGAIFRRSQMTRRLQISAGSSAGLAVAFNAPITGLVFAMEEAFRSFSAQVFISAAASVVTALFTRNSLRTLVNVALGENRFSVGYTFTTYTFKSVEFGSFSYFAIAALVASLFGVAFYYSFLGTKKLFKKITFWKKTGKYLIPFILAGVFGLITPYAMGGGHEFLQAIGTHGTGEYDIEQIFGIGLVATLAIVFLFKFLAGIMAMGCGVPCGVFIPMLAMGAGIGTILAIVFTSLGMDPAYADYLVIICMSVFFVSIVKAPITGIVMVFELTGQFQNFLPALMGVAIGYVISEVCHVEAIYEKCLDMFIHEEGYYANQEKIRVDVLVNAHSLADGALVRKIIWPTNGLVVNLIREDGSTMVPDGETMLHAGQTITFECETNSREDLMQYLYEICGTPEKK